MTDLDFVNDVDEDGELVAHDREESPALRAAVAAWKIECERIEGLRQRYAPDAAPWRPARPNEPPIARPSWLSAALTAESKIRDRERAAEEAEQIRRARCNISRGEFEDLLKLLGISIAQSADAARYAAWKAHMDKINSPHPSDFPPTPQEQARLDEINAASRKADQERRAANEQRFAESEQVRLKRERRR
jgi:hypothetical protein